MTYLKHVVGNHFTEYEGEPWAIYLFVLTGHAFGKITATPRYKGTREDIKKRRKRHWRLFT